MLKVTSTLYHNSNVGGLFSSAQTQALLIHTCWCTIHAINANQHIVLMHNSADDRGIANKAMNWVNNRRVVTRKLFVHNDTGNNTEILNKTNITTTTRVPLE